jgi:hypothetical protein
VFDEHHRPWRGTPWSSLILLEQLHWCPLSSVKSELSLKCLWSDRPLSSACITGLSPVSLHHPLLDVSLTRSRSLRQSFRMSVRSKKSFSEGGPGGSKKYHVDSLKLGKAAKRRSSVKHSTTSSKPSHRSKEERPSPKYTASDFGGKKPFSKAKEKAKESKSHPLPRSRSRSHLDSKKSKGAYEFEDATSSNEASSSSDNKDDTSEDSDLIAASSVASSHHSSHRRRGREKDKRRSSKHRTASPDTDDRRHHVKDKNKHTRVRSPSRERERDDRRRGSSRGDKQYRHRSQDQDRDAKLKKR